MITSRMNVDMHQAIDHFFDKFLRPNRESDINKTAKTTIKKGKGDQDKIL